MNPAGVPEYVDCNTTVVTAPPEPISDNNDSGVDVGEDDGDVGDAGDTDDFLGGIFDGNDDGDGDFFGLGLDELFGLSDDSTTDNDSYTIWEAVEGWVYSLFGS